VQADRSINHGYDKVENHKMALDIVFIEDLRIDTIIGIYDWEREVKQTIALHVEMAADNAKPASSEDIDDALNYKAVAKRLIAFTEESEIIMNEFSVPWCRLKLSKLGAVTGSRSVGVIIERGQR
jgi:dihydroneopterin aldolase